MQAHDAALALMLAAYNAPNDSEDAPESGTYGKSESKALKRGRPAKYRTPEELEVLAAKAAKRAAKDAANESKALEDAAKNRANVVCMAPAPYRLTAAEFMVRYRAAGRREKTVPSDRDDMLTQVKVCYDPVDIRNDVIELIACFCGYDLNQNFGSQDAMARMRAATQLQKSKLESGEIIPAKVTVPVETRGYVAGLPNQREKTKRRLIAHQWLAVDTLIETENKIREAVIAGIPGTVNVLQSLAQVEVERLASINRDLELFFPEVFETGEADTHETDDNDYN